MRKRNPRLAEVLRMQMAAFFCVGVLLAANESGRAQALVAAGAIDLKGNSITTDSFDSSAQNYPGYWTNSIRKAGGDVVTLGGFTNIIAIGNANIAGHVRIGPGANVSIMTNGSVGDLAWVDANTPGVEPGWLSDDANIVLKDVVIPPAIWTAAPGSGNATVYSYTGTTITGTNLHSFSHVITLPGNYTINDSGDIYVATNCTVNLKVLASVGTFAPNFLYEAGSETNAARVTCYVDCTNCTLGTGDHAQNWLPQNMVFLGTSNCTLLNYSGNGDFAGLLYFPRANFRLAGGGSGIIDFVGSCVVKTVAVNGHYHFHFDEALYQGSLPMLLFGAPLQNRSVVIGQDASLIGSVVGAQPLSYQWRFGGNDIPDATNSSLALTNIQLTNAGLYEAAVTNISGSVTDQVQLAVYDSATPTLQGATVSSGGVFQVSVGGVPSFSYALEVSTNLTDWVPVATNVAPYILSDTNAVFSPQGYYRAVYLQ